MKWVCELWKMLAGGLLRRVMFVMFNECQRRSAWTENILLRHVTQAMYYIYANFNSTMKSDTRITGCFDRVRITSQEQNPLLLGLDLLQGLGSLAKLLLPIWRYWFRYQQNAYLRMMVALGFRRIPGVVSPCERIWGASFPRPPTQVFMP